MFEWLSYLWIPHIVHAEPQLSPVALRPARGSVDQPGEQLLAVRDHMEVELLLGEQSGRLQHHLGLSDLPTQVTGLLGALSPRPPTQNQNKFYLLPPTTTPTTTTARHKLCLVEHHDQI